MFDPVDLSFYADAVLDELVSGEPQIDGTMLLDLARQADGPVLELGCGYGRITIPLAARGVKHLTGVELSAPSLSHARTKCGDLPIEWIEADVRDFHLERQYPFIFARGDVFNFMLTRVDQEAMLACVLEHLASDGQFMFDSYHQRPESVVDEPEESGWYTLAHPNGRQIFASGTSHFDQMQQLWIQRGFERWDSPSGVLVRSPWTLTLRYTMPKDLESLLHYNGFKIAGRYGDYRGKPATQEDPSHVYLCERR